MVRFAAARSRCMGIVTADIPVTLDG